jgi:hypothetical protein
MKGGSLTLVACTVSNNTAFDADDDGTTFNSDGGGIFFAAGGSLLVESSTVSGNQATNPGPFSDSKGGGIYFAGAVGAGGLVLRNSTVAGNTGGICSGGIGLANFTGTLVIRNCTITENSAKQAPGGGIERVSGTGAIDIASSIVSGNKAVSSPDILCGGTVLMNHSAVGSLEGFTPTGSNNLAPGTDLQLGALADNGGPTKTYAPGPGSPAIDKGANPSGLLADQRGFNRVSGKAADIGAVEYQFPLTVTSVQVNDGSPQRSRVTSLTVTFSEPPVLCDCGGASHFDLTRTGPGGPTGHVLLSYALNGNVLTITFNNGGAVNTEGQGSLIDGIYQLVIYATKVFGGTGPLDGNADGTGGDDFQTPLGPPGRLHRLFGDNDGDADVDATDFGAFRAAFGGSSNLAFDADGDNDVDATDFGAFRARFGSSV